MSKKYLALLILLAVTVPWPEIMPGRPAWAEGEEAAEPAPGMGTREIPRPDGGKDRIYYSITTPEEEKKVREEEKEKEEKSREVLRNVIIDPRKSRSR